MVTGHPRGSAFRTLPVPKDKLLGSDNRKDHSSEFVEFISCGRTPDGLKVAIVDPKTLKERQEGEVGEILISGPSIAKGYWNNAEKTKSCFGIQLSNNGQEGFCHTGDLGFVDDGELYVTGRLKDLIILRGKNHYPQDIEQTAGTSHPGLAPDSVGVFTIEEDGQQQLIIVQEIDRGRDPDTGAMIQAIRANVAAEPVVNSTRAVGATC